MKMRIAPRRTVTALLLAALLLAAPGGPAAADSGGAAAQGRTWRLLNTFMYQGITHGGGTLNMMEGRANGILPSGLIAATPGETRIWVATAISTEPVELGTEPWVLDLGGTSIGLGASWIPGLYDSGSQTFTPAAGTPVVLGVPGPSTFTPTAPFTVPARGLVALRFTGGTTPAVVDTFDETGSHSPSTLSVAGGDGMPDEIARTGARVARMRCDNRPTLAAEGCAERWVARRGYPENAYGTHLALSPDERTLFVAGSVTTRLVNQDMLVAAHDATTGALLWEDRYDGPGGPHDRARRVLVSPDGATVYVVGGGCMAPTTAEINCTSNYDVLVVAYDARTGARRWERAHGGPGEQQPMDAALSPDGTALLIAGYSSPVAGPSNQRDALALSLDVTDGRLRWSDTWAGAGGGEDIGIAVKIDGMGRAFVAGTASGAASGLDALVLGYDPTGARLLERTLDGGASADDRGANLVAGPDGQLFVVGFARQAGAASNSAALWALDTSSGALRWTRWHDGPWGSDDSWWQIALTPDGGTLVVGGSEQRTSTEGDAHLAALSAVDGSLRWERRYDAPGKSNDHHRGVALSADGTRVAAMVYSGWFSDDTKDMVTLVHDVTTGAKVRDFHYDGAGGGADLPNAAALTADGSRVFVTGASLGAEPPTYGGANEMTTIAYDVPR